MSPRKKIKVFTALSDVERSWPGCMSLGQNVEVVENIESNAFEEISFYDSEEDSTEESVSAPMPDLLQLVPLTVVPPVVAKNSSPMRKKPIPIPRRDNPLTKVVPTLPTTSANEYIHSLAALALVCFLIKFL
ncbi:hypothetical protein vseg_016048 [Gypsophila vaccaria]